MAIEQELAQVQLLCRAVCGMKWEVQLQAVYKYPADEPAPRSCTVEWVAVASGDEAIASDPNVSPSNAIDQLRHRILIEAGRRPLFPKGVLRKLGMK